MASSLLVLLAINLTEPRSAVPDDVQVSWIDLSVNYTNAPMGATPPLAISFLYGLGIGSNGSASILSISAPSGSVVWMDMSIDYTELGAGAPPNCSADAVSISSPFAITVFSGGVFGQVWSSHPLPLNLTGETAESGGSASAGLDMNITLPSQNGVYVPAAVLDVNCSQYN